MSSHAADAPSVALSSMIYLLAIFLPPVYFFTKKRAGAGVVTALLFCVSCILYITVALAPVGFVLWALSAIVAVWDLRKHVMQEQATMIAKEIAKTPQRS